MEEDRKKALEVEMLSVIVNIDKCRFWLKLLLANPGNISPLESFQGVDKVEENWREINKKKRQTSSNTNHQEVQN